MAAARKPAAKRPAAKRSTAFQAPTRLRLLLDATELAVLENGGELAVQLTNGDKNSSPALTVG